MRLLLIIALLFLAGCQATITVHTTDPETGAAVITEVETMRRVAVAVDGDQVTVISGQILINDSTVQLLGREAAKVADPL